MKLLGPLTVVLMMSALMAVVDAAELPERRNRQMGYVPGAGGGYMGGFYHPAQPMMGMPMQMASPMGVMGSMGSMGDMGGMSGMGGMGSMGGMSGMGSMGGMGGMGGMGMQSAGAQMYQRPSYQQMQQPYMNPYQQGGQGGMFPPPIRYTQYPAFSYYGAPQTPGTAEHHQQDEEEAVADEEDAAEAEEKAIAKAEEKPKPAT